jgi:hypothetical protein
VRRDAKRKLYGLEPFPYSYIYKTSFRAPAHRRKVRSGTAARALQVAVQILGAVADV